MQIRLADLLIEFNTLYPYTPHLCRDYIAEGGNADISFSVAEANILAEESGKEFPAYAESLAIYRKIAEEILRFDAFLMHGAVIEAEGEGIAFLARSGVGKSTHVGLWQKLLGDKMRIINGDKPLIRFTDGDEIPYAYGTPWAGKERLQTNARTLLKSVCFLERSAENSVSALGKDEILLSLLPQIYTPKDSQKLDLVFNLLSRFIESCRFYRLRCNMDIDAARVCYNAIFGSSE